MGCSPSKGKLFSKPDGLGNVQLEEVPPDCVDSRPVAGENNGSNVDECGALAANDEHTTDLGQSEEVYDTALAKVGETEVNVMVPECMNEVSLADKVKSVERRKNSKKQRCIEKLRKSSLIQTKVEVPPHMVRAQQAAYAFLNPNISKFETLLGLLDQATDTQLSLQPIMSALVLRFEEINQALEEMAEEGELMLKEHGNYMALPSGMMGSTVIAMTKSSNDKSRSPGPPPDLLLQLVQRSLEKMRHVGGLFHALGNTTLEDADEYFTSFSKMLVEKLKARRNAEQRISKVLAQVEVAAIRKCNPEDSALHSEDSGIGGENDSLTWSDRHRRQRGSPGSGNNGSGANVCAVLPNNAPNMVASNEYDEEEEEEENDNIDDEDDDRPGRKRSSSSPPDPLLYMHAGCMHDMKPKVQQPHTAAVGNKPEALLMMQESNEQMKKDSDIKGNRDLYMITIRRHSISGSCCQTGPCQLCPLPTLASQNTKRPSVKRLINTFSRGVEARPGQSLDNIPPHIRRPRKIGMPLSNSANCTDGGLVNNVWPDGRDDLDVENLPPPPPEVLLDNSFQGTESIPGNEKTYQDSKSLPASNKRHELSQRLRTSVQNVELLPNRASMKPRGISPIHPIRQDAIMGMKEEEQKHEPALYLDSSLYQQACKIIHLRNAAESLEQSGRGHLPQKSEINDICEGDMTCSLPVIAPPVSRVRLPPSCPSVHHRFPSPPVLRPQSSSSRPSSPKTITRAMDNQVEEIIPSVSFHHARSVFCQSEKLNSQPWTSSGTLVLPRPWGEESRGRTVMKGMDNSTRRTQSEQRPTIMIYSRVSKGDNSTGQ